jgi:Polyketide cyclase / dehydrase and lipid transport
MPHIQVTALLRVDADTVWRRAGSFQRLDWHPMVENVEGVSKAPGAVRKARSRDGQEQTEKLLAIIRLRPSLGSNPYVHPYEQFLKCPGWQKRRLEFIYKPRPQILARSCGNTCMTDEQLIREVIQRWMTATKEGD